MLRRSPVVQVALYYVIAIGAAVALLKAFPQLGIHFTPDPLRLVPGGDQLSSALGQGGRAGAPGGRNGFGR